MRFALYAVFIFSGFAGLIYESIWSHYLKLFLGHAAYAQTLVLTIFMGGMALGAWLAAGVSRRLSNPLYGYAAVELVLGVAALSFDGVFRGMQGWIFDGLIPALGDPGLVDVAKWILSALIILPQSMLLGATFPMMSAGIIRQYPSIPGSALGWLYFTNSLGASVGVLASGFLLIDWLGLPGTLMTAGLINFLLALGVYVLGRGTAAMQTPPTDVVQRAGHPDVLRLVLAAALLTGMASFLYEIGWIRMLSLVLGSATHSFEFMLSAFIFGLAVGSFWIRNRIDTLSHPLRTLGWIQVAMAGFALLSLPLYMHTFEAMAGFWHAVQSSDGGYVLFNLFSYTLCFLLMLPATVCAGMTLPLMTAILLRGGHGEASIGRVYAANTVGAIAGILLAVHIVMPVFGLRQVVIAGAVVDVLLGFWLLRVDGGLLPWRRRTALVAFAVGAAAILATVQFDPKVTGSGVYRLGQSRLNGEILFHVDGKTASVDVARYDDGTISIATNGKVDAGLNLTGKAGPDDYTMIMLALLPAAMHPEARTAAVIGMGSGTSSHMLLHNPRLERVDTIEIEPAMVEGARHFGKATHKVYDDPRSFIHIEDAKTYFARAGQRYDLILSEPSNPWVSGIASLFSIEFYDQVKRYLSHDGLFVQWLHLYEINQPLIATVMNALGDRFDDYVMYANNGDDIMIVAKANGRVPELDGWIFNNLDFDQPLNRLGMKDVSDLELRRIGGKQVLQPYFQSFGMPANSDYFPVLDQHSNRQRFLTADARALLKVHPYSMRLEGRSDALGKKHSPPIFHQPVPSLTLDAQSFVRRMIGEADPAEIELSEDKEVLAVTLQMLGKSCPDQASELLWETVLRRLTMETAVYLTPDLAARAVRLLRNSPCAARMGPAAAAWLDLFEAIGRGKPDKTGAAALAVLPMAKDDMPSAQFLVAELLLADLLASGPQVAAARLQQVQGLPDSVPLMFMRAQIESRLGVPTP